MAPSKVALPGRRAVSSSHDRQDHGEAALPPEDVRGTRGEGPAGTPNGGRGGRAAQRDRKSTRLNSSHANISYAVFCLKKKKNQRGRKQGIEGGRVHVP